MGRFLSADPVQPCPEGSHPGTQGYNLYAYVANNPTRWVDPSGYATAPAESGDPAVLAMLYAMGGGLHSILQCALDERCRAALQLRGELGSWGANLVDWTVESLEGIFFSTYPHQPTPVDPALLVLSVGLSNTPFFGDLYDLYSGVSGYDPLTGQYLAGWERLANIAGAIPIFGFSGANIRHGVHAAESLIDSGDEMAQFIGAAGKCRINSFSEETPVVTDEGAVPISEIDVGDRVLAWDELTDTTGYSAVSATFSHVDATIVELTIDGETLKTTADHPFYVVADAPWLTVGETQGRWVEAGDLQAGDAVQQADGTTGVVTAVKVVAQPQRMYNLTVADAHTFFVGDGEWLVHNCGGTFVDGVNLTHIFEGEINATGHAVGFHYAGGTWHVGKARIDTIISAPDANGVFRASVSVLDDSTGNWMAKNAPSSFFPSSWAEQQVVDEILAAFVNSTYLNFDATKFGGRGPSGVLIEGWLDSLGNIHSAFPVWGQ